MAPVDKPEAVWLPGDMLKILALVVIILMVLHLIRPLGLPGFRRRGDVWKIGLFLVVAMTLTIFLRP